MNTGATNETLQQSGNQDFFRQMLKSSASMYESSGSQFFRTTAEMQSKVDIFDKSGLVIIFLMNLGVIEILCSYRLVLEGKASKDIFKSSRLEFLVKFLVNIFLLDAEVNTSWVLSRGVIADLFLLRTLLAILQKSWESREKAKVLRVGDRVLLMLVAVQPCI